MTQNYDQAEKDVAADVAERLLGNATFGEAYEIAVFYLNKTKPTYGDMYALGGAKLVVFPARILSVSVRTLIRIYDVARQRGHLTY